jgi:hypothetical protein
MLPHRSIRLPTNESSITDRKAEAVRTFVSYSRRDDRPVVSLIDDLRRARHTSWRDEALGGGEDWWSEILEQIRLCDVFVFALSNNSVRSRPCLAELEYALTLGLPVLPVQVGPVGSLRMTPIAEKQVIDYRPRLRMSASEVEIAHGMIDLTTATSDLAARRGPLPNPLPPAPDIPFEYLMQIRLALDSEQLPARAQLQILTQLKQALRDEEDESARNDVLALLRRLRGHPETTYRNALDIDELLTVDPRDSQQIMSNPPQSIDPPNESLDIAPASSVEYDRRKLNPTVWSVFAISAGVAGIAHLGPIFYRLPLDSYLESVAFMTTMVVILSLTIAGVAASVVAFKMRAQWSRLAGVTSLAGMLIVVVILLKYQAAWGWATVG